jgi:hypothetical protein
MRRVPRSVSQPRVLVPCIDEIAVLAADGLDDRPAGDLASLEAGASVSVEIGA